MQSKAYDVVTERVIGLLEQGVCPWRRPWREELCGGVANLVSGHSYSGLNAMTLPALGFGSRFFLTFNQARAIGASVRAGEKAFPVVFWKFLESKDEKTGKKNTVPLLRYFSVFNVEQCSGVPQKAIDKWSTERRALPVLEACEVIVSGYSGGPPVQHVGARACYSASRDVVQMPPKEAFESAAAYYSVLFHELGHSTGHQSRLNRTFGKAFGSEDYGREELVAEMIAAFLGDRAGIGSDTLEMSAAYLDNWCKSLREDPRAVVVAAGAAQKGARLILAESQTESSEQAA